MWCCVSPSILRSTFVSYVLVLLLWMLLYILLSFTIFLYLSNFPIFSFAQKWNMKNLFCCENIQENQKLHLVNYKMCVCMSFSNIHFIFHIFHSISFDVFVRSCRLFRQNFHFNISLILIKTKRFLLSFPYITFSIKWWNFTLRQFYKKMKSK